MSVEKIEVVEHNGVKYGVGRVPPCSLGRTYQTPDGKTHTTAHEAVEHIKLTSLMKLKRSWKCKMFVVA